MSEKPSNEWLMNEEVVVTDSSGAERQYAVFRFEPPDRLWLMDRQTRAVFIYNPGKTAIRKLRWSPHLGRHVELDAKPDPVPSEIPLSPFPPL